MTPFWFWLHFIMSLILFNLHDLRHSFSFECGFVRTRTGTGTITTPMNNIVEVFSNISRTMQHIHCQLLQQHFLQTIHTVRCNRQLCGTQKLVIDKKFKEHYTLYTAHGTASKYYPHTSRISPFHRANVRMRHQKKCIACDLSSDFVVGMLLFANRCA